jgi:hypothetical protein
MNTLGNIFGKTIRRSLAVAATLAVTALGSVAFTAPAEARDSFSFGYSNGYSGFSLGVSDYRGRYDRHDRWDRRDYRRDHRHRHYGRDYHRHYGRDYRRYNYSDYRPRYYRYTPPPRYYYPPPRPYYYGYY